MKVAGFVFSLLSIIFPTSVVAASSNCFEISKFRNFIYYFLPGSQVKLCHAVPSCTWYPNLCLSLPRSSLVERNEGSYQPYCQTNLVVVLHELPIFFCNCVNTKPHLLADESLHLLQLKLPRLHLIRHSICFVFNLPRVNFLKIMVVSVINLTELERGKSRT